MRNSAALSICHAVVNLRSLTLEEAQTLVMNARVQLGWVDPADLVAAEEAGEEAEAAEESQA